MTQSSPYRAAFVHLLGCVTACAAAGAGAATPSFEGFNAPEPVRSDYQRVVAAHPGDPTVRAFETRVRAIAEVAVAVSEQMEAIRKSLVNKLAGDALGGTLGGAAVEAPPAAVVSAARILREYERDFTVDLPQSPVPDEDREALVAYHNALLHAAKTFIERRGEAVVTLGGPARDGAVRLGLVIPFLSTPDQKWAAADVEALPGWLRTRDALESCEAFALSVGRPFSAYGFAAARTGMSEGGARPPPMPSYLRGAAGKLVALREDVPAIQCLHVAAMEAASAKDYSAAASARIQLAELYASINRVSLAAAEMQTTLSVPSLPAGDYARCAMLRLKYLYAAGQFNGVCDEAATYSAEQRSSAHLPEILYIQSLALTRRGDQGSAKRVKEQFLRQFPEHPLGAEFHFADVLAAMAEARSEEVLRHIEIIESRYPESTLLPKVRELRKKLKPVPAAQK